MSVAVAKNESNDSSKFVLTPMLNDHRRLATKVNPVSHFAVRGCLKGGKIKSLILCSAGYISLRPVLTWYRRKAKQWLSGNTAFHKPATTSS